MLQWLIRGGCVVVGAGLTLLTQVIVKKTKGKKEEPAAGKKEEVAKKKDQKAA